MSFERYRGVIPEFGKFLEYASRPEPVTIRVRSGRIEPDALVERMARQGFVLRPIPDQAGFLRVQSAPKPIALTLEHWLGLFYVQRASTGLAAPALAPKPGERVLDMCAAPGGKTTHLADLMEDRGPLVAVDSNVGRMRALAGNVYRTGHTNVLMVTADGRELPGGAGFDRVLVDAPCSAEGTVREGRGRVRPRSEGYESYVTALQEGLLRRAIELTRPGGAILYSTCTFAPEENEAIVDAVLADMPVDVIPLHLPAPSSPGLTEFEGRRFDERLVDTARIYPHQLDSGGLFLALLRRRGTMDDGAVTSASSHDAGWTPIPRADAPDGAGDQLDSEAELKLDSIRQILKEVWCVEPSALDGVGWMLRNDRMWAHGCGEWPFDAWAGRGAWDSVAVGLRAFSFDSGGLPRPSNDLLRWLGESVTGRGVDLSLESWRRLLSGVAVEVEGVTDGYVALRLDGMPIGRGFVRSGRVRHEIPRVHARSLATILS
ncbi:MAG: RsmB/NOP family class I SAM-dependent RNA methyltransferase [marine benthic group bacterium]|nr:RsmB/NOP family class I SAM-dependent RNA methyltransferase [Gemmatimonadota bacterium]MCL7969138.1 RsmB/NOP family class I SAM-dependent RNA methyltransferase [Gemmatimonadota bacterium]MCL7990062.1 RsmB/NOP family class I SAM-dependent RNA methyltransferase [Gemmatimonadota bacterium]